jgi:predicted Rossmann fold nucleotide-binding protein DprA/Smf involved in DNA uptake
MNTPDLFGGPIFLQRGQSIVPRDSKGNARPLSRRNGPHTSDTTAESMQQGALQHRAKVLACLVVYGPQTFWQIAARTGLDGQQVNKRLPELQKQGTIDRITIGLQDGKPIFKTLNSPSGRPCAIWRVL